MGIIVKLSNNFGFKSLIVAVHVSTS